MIERWDPASSAADLYEIHVSALAVDDPEGPVFTPRMFGGWLARGWHDEPREVWSIPGVGWYRLILPDRANTGRASLDLQVTPTARRQGHGSALLEHALGRAAANGRTLLRGWAWAGSPGDAFAEVRGGSHDHTDIVRVQDVTAEIRRFPVADGYSLVTWTGRAPDELLGGIADIWNAMADAPRSEGAEATVCDAQWAREQQDLQEIYGTREYAVAALHDATGAMAALTQVAVDPDDPEWGYQEITAVVGAHRGHRLGLAVKSAMLDLLLPAEPALRRIMTNNAENNKHMIAVNEALGYEIFGPPVKNYRLSVEKA